MPLGDGGADADAQAKRAYAQRLIELTEELDEAKENSDLGRQSKLGADREALLAEVKRAGWNGTGRRNGGDRNRVRNSVCNAIGRALDAIGKYDPAAHAHLKSSLSLGFSVVYQPAAPVPWSF